MFFKDCWIKVDADRHADLGVSTKKTEILQHSYASTIKILQHSHASTIKILQHSHASTIKTLQHSYASTTGIALLPFCKRIHVPAKIANVNEFTHQDCFLN